MVLSCSDFHPASIQLAVLVKLNTIANSVFHWKNTADSAGDCRPMNATIVNNFASNRNSMAVCRYRSVVTVGSFLSSHGS